MVLKRSTFEIPIWIRLFCFLSLLILFISACNCLRPFVYFWPCFYLFLRHLFYLFISFYKNGKFFIEFFFWLEIFALTTYQILIQMQTNSSRQWEERVYVYVCVRHQFMEMSIYKNVNKQNKNALEGQTICYCHLCVARNQIPLRTNGIRFCEYIKRLLPLWCQPMSSFKCTTNTDDNKIAWNIINKC